MSTTHEITLSPTAGSRPPVHRITADSYSYDPDSRLVEFTSGDSIVLAVAREELVSIARVADQPAAGKPAAEIPEGAPTDPDAVLAANRRAVAYELKQPPIGGPTPRSVFARPAHTDHVQREPRP